MSANEGFRSKEPRRVLQPGEKLDIIFNLVCMMAEKTDKTKYKKVKEEWNKGNG